ncbi:MAG: YkgJ family cysteine cluster protein [Chlamydiales bacterium]
MNNSDCKLPWYKEGLRFKCTGCGDCCSGTPGFVWLNQEDLERFSQHFQISVEAFLRKYTRRIGLRISLLEDTSSFDCIFLKNRKCSVYTSRPAQCRSYPFWSAILESKDHWDIENTYCEGINHPDASLVPFEEIIDKKEKL